MSVFGRIFKRRSVYLVELPSDATPSTGYGPKDIRISCVDWSNVNRIEAPRSASVAHAFRQKLTSGHLGVYALSGDEVVGCFWAEPSGPTVIRAWGGIDYGPNEVLLAWGWVSPNHRRRGIFQDLITHLSIDVRTRFPGHRILADVPMKPIGSLRAHRRVGFRLYGQLDYATVARRLVHRQFKALDDGYADLLIGRNIP